MILITGAAGMVGCAVISEFSRRGIQTRAFIHNYKDEQKVISVGATEVYIGDMTNGAEVDAALEGADSIYYICNAANPREDTIGKLLIDCALDAGGIYFVYHSVLHSIEPNLIHHQKKLKVEQMLIESGLPYTIIQPAVFMQTLVPAIASVKEGGALKQKFFTSRETTMSFIDVKDMARAAAEIVASGRFIDATVELCAPGRLTLTDVEEAFAQAHGNEVVSEFIEDEDFLKTAHIDKDSYEGEALLKMFDHYNTNGFNGNSAIASYILKKPPKTLAEFLNEEFAKEYS